LKSAGVSTVCFLFLNCFGLNLSLSLASVLVSGLASDFTPPSGFWNFTSLLGGNSLLGRKSILPTTVNPLSCGVSPGSVSG